MRDGKTAGAVSRRGLLAGAAAAAAAGVLVVRSSRVALAYDANQRLNLAIVGVAGYGAANAFVPAIHTYGNAGIVALADVDTRKVAPALELWKQRAAAWPTSAKPEERKGAEHYVRLAEKTPPLFADFRVMLERMGREIDAVVVATPDHSHATASAAALRAGKPVFCEKPLTVRVSESRALRELAVAQKISATSMGNQGTQSGPLRRGVELLRGGAIGDVSQVHLWFARGGANLKEPPRGAQEVPRELAWDLWLGPVAWREYHRDWIARTNWRDTSAGQLGNFGPHTGNLAFMGLNIAELWTSPDAAARRITVEAECSEVNRLSFPVWERMTWKVPARGAMPGVTWTWHHGKDYAPGARGMLEKLLRDHGATDEDVKKWLVYAGAAIVGSKGVMVTDSHNVNVALLPKARFAGVQVQRPAKLEPSRGHYQDWIAACRGGPAPWARFEYAATLTEFLMLGDVATRFPGRSLAYDPVSGKIVNDAEASGELGYAYREGWRL